MNSGRKIIHIDMDAFFASVEQRDNPNLQGRPVVVGGNPRSRGVVAACSYEARKYGIRSAMPCAKAWRLCPKAIFIRPQMDKYRQVSGEIMAIFRQYTNIIEPLSLDEAFLDATLNNADNPSASLMAKEICLRIHRELGLTASAGVSCNKFLAKAATEVNKPNGITVITPRQAAAFIDQLPVGKFFGVGRVTEKRMLQLGIRNGRDLRKFGREDLVFHFGRQGAFFHDIARGVDNRPVAPARRRKSIGSETTFQQDLIKLSEIIAVLESMSRKLAEMLAEKGLHGRTATLKVRYHDFRTITRSNTIMPISSAEQIMEQVRILLPRTEAGKKSVRLLGISVSKLGKAGKSGPVQLTLPFPPPGLDDCIQRTL